MMATAEKINESFFMGAEVRIMPGKDARQFFLSGVSSDFWSRFLNFLSSGSTGSFFAALGLAGSAGLASTPAQRWERTTLLLSCS